MTLEQLAVRLCKRPHEHVEGRDTYEESCHGCRAARDLVGEYVAGVVRERDRAWTAELRAYAATYMGNGYALDRVIIRALTPEGERMSDELCNCDDRERRGPCIVHSGVDEPRDNIPEPQPGNCSVCLLPVCKHVAVRLADLERERDEAWAEAQPLAERLARNVEGLSERDVRLSALERVREAAQDLRAVGWAFTDAGIEPAKRLDDALAAAPAKREG